MPRIYYYKPSKPRPNTHPLIKQLLAEMERQQCTYEELSKRSGVNKSTLKQWRVTGLPLAASLEAAFNALGMKLTAVRMKDDD